MKVCGFSQVDYLSERTVSSAIRKHFHANSALHQSFYLQPAWGGEKLGGELECGEETGVGGGVRVILKCRKFAADELLTHGK